MSGEVDKIIVYRLTQADESLHTVRLHLDHGLYRKAVREIYYACFYAVTALLLAEGHSASKHTGIRSFFMYYWIRTGRLPVSFGKMYSRFFKYRQRADYEVFVEFSEEEVRQWLSEAEELIAAVQEKIKHIQDGDL